MSSEHASGQMFGMETRTLAVRTGWSANRLDALAAAQSLIENHRRGEDHERIRQIAFVELTAAANDNGGDGWQAHALVVFETDLDIKARWGVSDGAG